MDRVGDEHVNHYGTRQAIREALINASDDFKKIDPTGFAVWKDFFANAATVTATPARRLDIVSRVCVVPPQLVLAVEELSCYYDAKLFFRKAIEAKIDTVKNAEFEDEVQGVASFKSARDEVDELEVTVRRFKSDIPALVGSQMRWDWQGPVNKA
ncbi:hypothetical protein BAUCODRAFT_152847 [Baudoinia panamericana UAMH 10762]|uniref:Uncharacterized protein n=1 Tax=Baudoinia panamericana (strain UAMH 10762) TaxID=717646 RepID=M2MW96_BAUPA|nr:uncharacterized protein BAUCODRAFT_152847 [Baudoinia panamericana UAMH 10762]EMC90854.1 hypothetical protein BAUCODRAFT_152847 [Baudoinia panamericana UAMH 10762]